MPRTRTTIAACPLPTSSGASSPAMERRFLAIVCSILLHLVLFGGGAVATAIVASWHGMSCLPRRPLLVLALGFILAHTSLGAIWWARANWSPNLRTLTAGVVSCGLWLLLIGVLNTARASGVVSAAWAASVLTQVVLTAGAAIAIEIATDYDAAASRNRFGIRFLLIWTTLIAALLGGAEAWAAQRGWKLADVPKWEFFTQLQLIGLANAVLAVGVQAVLRQSHSRGARAAASIAVVAAIASTTPPVMFSVFGDKVGAEAADLVWLLGSEGLFMIATLLPLETLSDSSPATHVARSLSTDQARS